MCAALACQLSRSYNSAGADCECDFRQKTMIVHAFPYRAFRRLFPENDESSVT